MKVNVKLFALAKQLAGSDTIEVELSEAATVNDLRRGLAETCPALEGLMNQMMIAVDSEYADDTTAIMPGADVACIPPVSGG